MSNSIFPVLPGLGWSVKKTPSFKTMSQEVASGKEIRLAMMTYPIWTFGLTYEVLRGANGFSEVQTLAGFFCEMLGCYDSFLFDDVSDNTATTVQFGVGDGVTTKFQLVRPIGGFAEPIQNLNGTPTIYDNGLTPGAYTIGSTGIVTFNTTPTSEHILTWTGAYYFRCRFLQDLAEFDQFMSNLWTLKKLEMKSVKL
jgi:uncharacterized protein (TIGR02217 family)